MFDSLLRIGEIVGGGAEIPVKDIKKTKGKMDYFCLVVFDCNAENDAEKVRLERYYVTESTAREWVWVGNFLKGSNESMIFATTDELSYILGFDRDGELVPTRKFALHNIGKYLKETKLGRAANEILKWYRPEDFASRRNDYDWDCALYSMKAVCPSLGEVSLADEDVRREYEEFLKKYYILGKEFLKKGRSALLDGVRCQFCGRSGVLPRPQYSPRSLLKVFSVDKKGFSSGISDSYESWTRAHAVCPSCFMKLGAGADYVEKELRAQVGRLDVYIIPALPPGVGRKELDILILMDLLRKHIQDILNLKAEGEGWILRGLRAMELAESDVKEAAEYWEYLTQLTLVFGRKSNSKFDAQLIVPDVGVPRLVEVIERAQRIYENMGLDRLISAGEDAERVKRKRRKKRIYRDINLDLVSLYAIMPVREARKGVDAGPFLEAVDALLQGYAIDRRLLMHRILRQLRCIRYGTCENGLTKRMFGGDLGLEMATALAAGFIRLLDPQEPVEGSAIQVLKDPARYAEAVIKEDGFRGAFLLGALTAYVANEQWRKSGRRNKPILNRIDYEGMSYQDLQAYAVRLLKSLKDHGQLSARTEELYARALSYLNSGRERLSNPEENVFYLLFGYSYQTLMFISASRDKEENNV
ncbi:MAG: TM1802 family CRISPR-associated protein [Nitrososphaeria archaeon]